MNGVLYLYCLDIVLTIFRQCFYNILILLRYDINVIITM